MEEVSWDRVPSAMMSTWCLLQRCSAGDCFRDPQNGLQRLPRTLSKAPGVISEPRSGPNYIFQRDNVAIHADLKELRNFVADIHNDRRQTTEDRTTERQTTDEALCSM
uniref:Secreted protein n=1 Tax=Haemonchus contortus TaxID=6289 RepID=A0A7I4Z047_HAECO